MRQLIICVGLPGSGKSTWTRSQVEQHPDRYKRINRDDLRSMVDNGKYSSGREKYIRQAELALAEMFLLNGYTVIVDDCNLSQSAKAMWQEFAKKHNAIVEIQDFTHVSLEECIERDRKRPNYVGEQAIRRMHRQFLETKPTPPVYDPELPDCIIVDLDGTLALFDRDKVSPYDRDFSKDEINEAVRDLIWHHGDTDTAIFLFSGRKDTFREQTMTWLENNRIPHYHLHMRKADDTRKDAVIKEEMYNEHINGKYNVITVIDDRLQVCRMWHRLGLPLFRVGDPDADF
jgi:predicted kinase